VTAGRRPGPLLHATAAGLPYRDGIAGLRPPQGLRRDDERAAAQTGGLPSDLLVGGVTMQRTGTRVAAAVAAGLVVQACLPLLGDRTGVVFDNVLLALIALVTAIGHARQTRLSRDRRRAAWALACAAAVLWSLSSAIDTVDAFLSLDTGSDEFLAVSAAIASLVALVLLGTADRVGPAVRLRRGIDVATVSGALFFLAWEFVLAPASATLPPSASTMITMVLVPEIIGAGYALVLLSHSLSRRGDEALSLLAAGLLGFAATMLLAVHNLVEGLPWYATGVGAGYVIAGLLTALASHAPLPSGTFAEENEDAGRWALLPFVPVGLAFAAAAWRYVHSGNVTAVLFWLLLATSALVLVRQFLSMRTTRKLTDDLRAQRAELAHQASHDALTGLVNRTAFQQRATATVAAAGADGLTGVLLIDLDGCGPATRSPASAGTSSSCCCPASGAPTRSTMSATACSSI
jgi:ABC-type multidrug transport system fused ATPase/permease subunit